MIFLYEKYPRKGSIIWDFFSFVLLLQANTPPLCCFFVRVYRVVRKGENLLKDLDLSLIPRHRAIFLLFAHLFLNFPISLSHDLFSQVSNHLSRANLHLIPCIVEERVLLRIVWCWLILFFIDLMLHLRALVSQFLVSHSKCSQESSSSWSN